MLSASHDCGHSFLEGRWVQPNAIQKEACADTMPGQT
jgi:hypothetical protein